MSRSPSYAPLVLHLNPNASAAHKALNVLDGQSAEDIQVWMYRALADRLTPEQQDDLVDSLEALVPALVELRDRYGQTLNLNTVVEHANVTGFARLAFDERLSSLNRLNCDAMARRHAVYLKRAMERLRRAQDGD